MNVLAVLRQLIGKPEILHFLFTTYDLKQVSQGSIFPEVLPVKIVVFLPEDETKMLFVLHEQ